MRCVAGAGLLVLVGCNQVFGIRQTEPYDAGPDVIPDLPYVKLTWQIADVLPSGDPDPRIVDAPIAPAPQVRYAAPGQPFQDTTYSPVDGSIIVARALFDNPMDAGLPTWRLEYTLADNLPHEVQWSPDDKHGQLTVPLFGRADRAPVPTGGGYNVTPELATGYQSPRVFTTGIWTEGLATNHTGAMISYDFFNAASMSGPKGSPDPGHGDKAFLIDYGTDAASCRVAIGSTELVPATLVPGMHSQPTATWDTRRAPVSTDIVSLQTLARFSDGFGGLGGDLTAGSISLGIAANVNLPGLTGVPASRSLPVTTVLPAPVMVTVASCPFDPAGTAPLPDAAQPAALANFSRLLHVQLTSTRRVLGVSLGSGMETAIASPTSENLKLTFPAAIPTAIQLATPGNGTIDLIASAEGVAVGRASGPFTLSFVPEADKDVRADYYDVLVHRFDAGALTTVRIYTVTSPRVVIDGPVLSAGGDYVLEIRSFKGHPDARRGDFRPVDYPYGSAILFTRTFHVS